MRATLACLQLLSSGRQRTANDQAAGEWINQLQGTLTQLSMAHVHDRKLLLEVREMVLELRHQDGGTSTHRASYRAGNGAPAPRAQALQEEVLALATTLEAKLDEFKGCIATLQQSQTALSQPLPTGGRTPSPDVTVTDIQQRADYGDPLGC